MPAREKKAPANNKMSGRWSKYGKKYKTVWEEKEGLKDWIMPVLGDNTKASCRFCHNTLRAHHSDLMSHASTVKHKRNASQGGPLPQPGKKIKITVKKEKKKLKVEDYDDNNDDDDDDIMDAEEDYDAIPITVGLREEKGRLGEVVNPASVGFIGCGNIVHALLSAFLKEGLIDPDLTVASAPTDDNLPRIQAMGVRTTHDNNEVVRSCDLVFLCVRPQVLSALVSDLAPIENDDHNPLFMSVVTGVSLATLEQGLSSVIENPRVVRVLPNSPVAVKQGCCLYTLGSHTSPSDGDVTRSMLGSLGLCIEVREPHLDSAAGIVCAGPAFIFTAIEGLADGGVKMGLPRHMAVNLAAQTIKGSAQMVLETGKHPGQLKDEVCSPAGTTIAALHTLERHAFRNTIISAVQTATRLVKNIVLGKRNTKKKKSKLELKGGESEGEGDDGNDDREGEGED